MSKFYNDLNSREKSSVHLVGEVSFVPLSIHISEQLAPFISSRAISVQALKTTQRT